MARSNGIYASSLSRRDLARRRARLRAPLALRAAAWVATVGAMGVAAVVAERLVA